MFLFDYFNNLKISYKLLIGYALVGFLLVVGTGAGLASTAFIKNQADSVYANHVVTDNRVVSVYESANRIQSELTRAIIDPANLVSSQSIISQKASEVDQDFLLLERAKLESDQFAQLSEMKKNWVAYKNQMAEIQTQMGNGRPDAAVLTRMEGDLERVWVALRTSVEDWRKTNFDYSTAQTESTKSYFTVMVILLVGAGSLGVIISQMIGLIVARSITSPLRTVTSHLRRLSVGQSGNDQGNDKNLLRLRKDEIGQLARDLEDVDEYIQSVAGIADQIAHGNLGVTVVPRGAEDQLGQALSRMVDQLADLVHQVSESSNKVGNASQQLLQAASQTRIASEQITNTIQQVAQGLNRQSMDMDQTMSAIETTTHSIQQVARGANDQEQAVEETKLTAGQMDSAILQVIRNMEAVSQAAQESTGRAEDGAGTLRQTVSSMQEIRTQVEDLDAKITAVGDRSDEIGSIIEAIEDIASKTNILAINATIEAAHAEVQARKLTEEIMNQMMVSQLRMVNQMLLDGVADRDPTVWVKLCASTRLDTILVTDADGVTVQCNESKLIGWRFPEDPKAQAYPFRSLLHQKDGVYCQDSQSRSMDHEEFKYVGISRADQPGIVQVGYRMENMRKFDLRVGGFAVVAGEVYQLAERASQSTKEIRSLVKGIQSSVRETIAAMQHSRNEVETGMERAGSAGNALEQILEAVHSVSVQAHSALDAAAQMKKLSTSLSGNVITFSRIMEDNNRSVTELDAGYNQIAKTMENVARLGEENGAAAEEVSASSEEMRTEMEEVNTAAESLEAMARTLEELVSRFQYAAAVESAPVLEIEATEIR